MSTETPAFPGQALEGKSSERLSAQWPLLLGSASPRRRDILQGLGIPIVVRPSDVDEQVGAGETVAAFLERIVAEKLAASLRSAGTTRFAAALAADTVVVIDGQILGKPKDTQDAIALVSQLCGRTHQVNTRYAIELPAGQRCARTVQSEVDLRAATPAEIAAYAHTGEGLDKAGAYAAQGIGAFLVRGIRGSYTNVVGLPACEVIEDLTRLGVLPPFPLRL
jgi:septum formation protein